MILSKVIFKQMKEEVLESIISFRQMGSNFWDGDSPDNEVWIDLKEEMENVFKAAIKEAGKRGYDNGC